MSQWPARVRRIIAEQTDSTFDEAQRWDLEARDHPTWILALRQSAARGRRGRPWQHPFGNFAATVVLPRAGHPEAAAKRSFSAAVAVHMAIEELTGSAEGVALKWPNDVLIDGAKVAGILLERLGSGPGLAIGFGVNLVAAPGAAEVEPGAVPPGSILAARGVRIAPQDFLDALGPAFHRLENIYITYGFDHIRDRWLKRAARLGEIVTARLPKEEITGRFVGIDGLGRLQLQTPTGPRDIAAADVYF